MQKGKPSPFLFWLGKRDREEEGVGGVLGLDPTYFQVSILLG